MIRTYVLSFPVLTSETSHVASHVGSAYGGVDQIIIRSPNFKKIEVITDLTS